MPVGPYTGAQSSVGNGVTTIFPYSWKVLDQTHIEVRVDGLLKVLGGDYTVSGVGNSAGGNVTFLVAPANLAIVQRTRKVPYKRDTDYQANGDFKEETVDADFDIAEMQIQQIAADVARAFKAPLSVTADQVLTDAQWAARFSTVFGFGAAGELTLFSPASAVTDAGNVTYLNPATGSQGTTVSKELTKLSAVKSALTHWSSGPAAGKKIAWVGDSTTLGIETNANVIAYRNANYVTNAGSALTGVTLSFFSSNGDTLQNFIINATAGKGVNDVIAVAPDLVILSYGINDVRLGNRTKAQIQADLITAVDKILAALPNCDVVLRMPNSFLTTDVGALGYVVPNGSAQDYSTRLKDAYRALANRWPNVVLFDAQATLFPEACPALYLYMADQLHPNEAGYEKIFDKLVEIIVPNNPANPNRAFNKGFADHAQSVSFGAAHLTYPDVVLNGDYTFITRGTWAVQGSGFLRFLADDALNSIGKICGGDIVVQNGQAAFALPAAVAVTPSAANVQLGNLGGGIPTYGQTGGYVEIWRPKYSTALGLKQYVGNAAYQAVKRVMIGAAGNTFARVREMPGEAPITEWQFKTTDIFYSPSVGATTLTGATFPHSGADIQIGKGGVDWTADTNTIGFLFSAASVPRSDPIVRKLSVAVNLNNAGGEVQVTGLPWKYIVRKVTVFDATVSLAASAATLGVFTATGGAGTTVVASATMPALTAGSKFVDRAIAANADYLQSDPLFIRNGVAHGSAATCSVMIEVEEVT